PHNTTKAQIGLGNVDNVQQASKKEFEEHRNDLQRHITPVERENWNAKETIVGAQEKADPFTDTSLMSESFIRKKQLCKECARWNL
ncbi:hypothetical protein FX995_24030, partial [Pseudoalteromonas flavipulchra]